MKKYSWISYISLALPIVLIGLIFLLPHLDRQQQQPDIVFKAIIYAQIIGPPMSVILGVIALFKKNEKKTIAIIGLIISLILIVSLAYIILLAFGIGGA